MDQKELQEKIALYYSKLPPNVQAVFSSMKWLETLKTISQKYGLSEQQIETLGIETTLALLGIIHLVEYEEMLTKELGLSTSSLEKILMEIEESIFKSIRPQLVEAFDANKKSETEEGSEIEIKTKLDKKFERLPEEIKDILQESNYQEKLYGIAKEYNLTVAQMGILETAVVNLITDVIHPEGFEKYLENNLKLPLETTQKLVKDINEKIFLKIRGLLKSMNPQKEERFSLKETDEPQNNDIKILNSTGIEIIPEKLELTTVEKPAENREEVLKEIEKPETIHPILAQKLSGSFQTPVVKTNHSLDNLTSNNPPSFVPKPKIDPYREIPE